MPLCLLGFDHFLFDLKTTSQSHKSTPKYESFSWNIRPDIHNPSGLLHFHEFNKPTHKYFIFTLPWHYFFDNFYLNSWQLKFTFQKFTQLLLTHNFWLLRILSDNCFWIMLKNIQFMTHHLKRIDQIRTFLLMINEITDQFIKTKTTPTNYLPK